MLIANASSLLPSFAISSHRRTYAIPCLVARDDDFGSARQRFAVFAARAAGVPRAFLRENDFAGAARANRADDAAQHAHAFVVGRIEFAISASAAAWPRTRRRSPRPPVRATIAISSTSADHQRRIARQQITRPAEPRQKRGDRAEVEERHLRAACARRRELRRRRVRPCHVRHVHMDVRQVPGFRPGTTARSASLPPESTPDRRSPTS